MKQKVLEGLFQNDLEYMVSSYVSIDQYTSKVYDDNITIAFFVNEKNACMDLKDFIEKTYFIEIRDIEVSNTMTEDNKYILFVEFERNSMFPKILLDLLSSINILINCKMEDWEFKSLNMKKKEKITDKNIKRFVRLTRLEFTGNKKKSNNDEKKKTNESKEFKYNNYSMRFVDKGEISEGDFSKLMESKIDVNFGNSLAKEIISYNFPQSDVIELGNSVFVIDGKLIKEYSYK